MPSAVSSISISAGRPLPPVPGVLPVAWSRICLPVIFTSVPSDRSTSHFASGISPAAIAGLLSKSSNSNGFARWRCCVGFDISFSHNYSAVYDISPMDCPSSGHSSDPNRLFVNSATGSPSAAIVSIEAPNIFRISIAWSLSQSARLSCLISVFTPMRFCGGLACGIVFCPRNRPDLFGLASQSPLFSQLWCRSLNYHPQNHPPRSRFEPARHCSAEITDNRCG